MKHAPMLHLTVVGTMNPRTSGEVQPYNKGSVVLWQARYVFARGRRVAGTGSGPSTYA